MGKHEEAQIYFDKAINLNPNCTNAYYNKGVSLLAMAKNEEAIACFDEAKRLEPNYYATYNDKGAALQTIGKEEEAVLFYDKAISLNPNQSTTYFNKGSALKAMGKNEEALICYEKGISLSPNPSDTDASANKGAALSALGKTDEAIVCYDRVISLKPNDVAALTGKGAALSKIGKNEEAIVCYDKAIRIDPNYLMAYNNKGAALKALGKNEEAVVCFDKAISLYPNHANAYCNKGAALQTLGKNEEALVCHDKAIDLNSNYSVAYLNKGAVLQTLRKDEEALVCYGKAIHFSDSRQSLYYCCRGCLYNKLGQTQAALDDFKTAHKLVQQGFWGSHVSTEHITWIRETLSAILELEKVAGETEKLLNRLDQRDSDVKDAVDQFKTIQREKSVFISEQVARLEDENIASQGEMNKTNEKIQDLESQLKELNEKLNKLMKRVSTVEKTVQEMKTDIEKIREDMKTSGVMDKVRIQQGFTDLEKNAQQLYAYAKAFYWTLINYLMAHRNASTGILQGNTDSASGPTEKYLASATSYVIELGIDMIESIPLVEKVIRILNETMKMVYENVKERRFENRVNIINKIIMEHNGEDDINTTVAFTALDVAFKLRAGNTFDFDEPKSDGVWEKVKGKLTEQIEKIKNLVLEESIDLYEGPAAAAALRDVLLLLAYLYERYEFVIAQKKNQEKPFHEQFASIIVLKKYTEVLENHQEDGAQKIPEAPSCKCGEGCSIF